MNPPPGVRQRQVGLAPSTWTAARVRAVQGGPAASQSLADALARYVEHPEFRRVVADASAAETARLRYRNVRLPDDLWAGFAAAAPTRRAGATANMALRLHLATTEGATGG